jgi:hypothetical protein
MLQKAYYKGGTEVKSKMLKKMALSVMIAGLFSWGGLVYAEVNLHEGLWEITTRLEMRGVPMQMPAQKQVQCLTKESMLKSMEPKGQDKEGKCKVTDEVMGDTMIWIMECSGEGAIEVTTEITCHGDTFEGTITTVSKEPGTEKVRTINHISGKRIGECR